MTSSRLLILAGLLAAVTLAGCGRKSDLDTPSMARQAEREASGESDTTPPPPPREDKRFILDGLID